MTNQLYLCTIGVTLACALLVWTPVQAQVVGGEVVPPTGAGRPYRALFGGSAAKPDVRHSFDLVGAAFGGYDDNELPSGMLVGAGIASPLLRTGAYSGASVNATYSWQGRRAQIGASLGTSARYYPDTSDLIGTGHHGAVGVSAEIGRRGRIVVTQSISLAPSYLYSLMPTGGRIVLGSSIGGGEFPVGGEDVQVYDTAATVTYTVTRRSSVEAVSSYRFSDFRGHQTPTLDGLRSYSAGGRFRYGLSRHASLRLGYVYREGRYGLNDPLRANASRNTAVHDLDVGVDYRRALSLTRRTSIDFGTGSAIVSAPVDGAEDPAIQYRLVGNIGVMREFGRTWHARLGYNRGVEFAEAFNRPVFTDAVLTTVTGFVTRRLDFNAAASVAAGEVGLAEGSSRFRTWSVTTRMRYALSASLALYGEYLYYAQDLGHATIVPAGLPSQLGRQTARVGLTVWVPLIRK